MIQRLIIIGNGFDIAHGLKTKYSDFIDNYYYNINDTSWNDDFLSFKFQKKLEIEKLKDLQSIVDNLASRLFSAGYSKLLEDTELIRITTGSSIKVNNKFFYSVSQKKSLRNWVDIENEYYKVLINLLDKKPFGYVYNIKTLNNELDLITKLFEEYLCSTILPKIDSCYNKEIAEIIHNEFSDITKINFFLDEELPIKQKSILKERFYNWPTKSIEDAFKNQHITVLNFNYTPTFEKHYSNKNIKIINIHGSVKDTGNPINLGFGDEMDKRYSDIENFNNNEYLKYMKSFAYSRSQNYKKLLDFIETNEFQVQIMGHSCGISDRTLLNTIFEHHNCKSIKVFYHEFINEKGVTIDNYSDIVMNISRHFNKKALMREKIVNKQSCRPLPQFSR